MKVLKREPSSYWIVYNARGGGLFNFFFSRQASRSLVIHFNKKLVTFSHYQWSLAFLKCMCTWCSYTNQSDWSLVIYFGHLLYKSCQSLVEPPDCRLVHFGKREILSHIDSMKAEYEEVLSWVDPGADGADASSSSSASPWGEGIHVFGMIQPLKRCQIANLMADSYGFTSIEELSRVQKYLHEHGGWQLEQVSIISKRLVACYYS